MCWLLVGRGQVTARITGRVGGALAVIVLLLMVVLMLKPELLQLHTFMQAVGLSENFSGRESLWMFALEQFWQQPWLGYGFDSLASVLGKVNMAVGQLHNGYLDLLVRGGVIGMSLFVLMTLVALSRNFMTATQGTGPVWSTVLLLVVLVHNISESSLARSTHTLWLLYTICAFVAAHSAMSARVVAVGRNYAPSNAHPAGTPALPNLLR
jgi:O-antigen ligase